MVSVISPGEFDGEQAFLWSLGIEEVTDAPRVVILYGRGRMIGPVLDGDRLNRESISAILDTIGLNCECGLDRKWMQGAMVPLKWDRDRKQQMATQLGFNPESPEIRIEMSQILAKGGPGQGVHRSKIIGDTLDELLTGHASGSLAPKPSPLGQAEELTVETTSGISVSIWAGLVAVAILVAGGLIFLTARSRNF